VKIDGYIGIFEASHSSGILEQSIRYDLGEYSGDNMWYLLNNTVNQSVLS
jgi:hypothetical protein